MSKGDPTRVAYYRHVGFERHFRRIGESRFLEINPTYHYTSDGHEPHPFREEYLAKIRTIEGNNAVGGLSSCSLRYFKMSPRFFARRTLTLALDTLERVQVPVGIEDASWSKRDELQPPSHDEVDEFDSSRQLELFDDES